MKNRSTKILIIAIFILIATIGCTNDNSKNIESKLSSIGDKIEKDDIYVIPEKVNYTFYEKFSIMHSFSIDFLSSSEIDISDINVEMKTKVSYGTSITKIDEEQLDLNTFFLYNDISVFEFEKLKKSNQKEYESKMEEYSKEYEQLRKAAKGKVYRYRIDIEFNMKEDGDNETIKEVVVKYKNNEKRINIGNIKLNYDSKLKRNDKALEIKAPSESDIFIENNKEGIINYLGQETLKSNKDIVLKNISIYNSDNKIKKCLLQIKKGKSSTEKEWEKAVKIKKGAKIDTSIIIENKELADNFSYQCNEYLVFDYEVQGKKYTTYTELVFTTKASAYELYAHYLDKK